MTRARRALVLAVVALILHAARAEAQSGRLLAGAVSVTIDLPDDTPLGGYGGFPRRAWIPDLIGRAPDTFWFHASTGVHDPIKVRALVLEAGGVRVLWLAIDLVGMDPTLVSDLRARLERLGLRYSAVIAAASHTHSGPGAYARSNLFGFLAVDRESPRVRGRIFAAMEAAARQADRRKRPAIIGTGRSEITGVAVSRVRGPLDPELGVLKVMGTDNRPVAVLWNYAIHGTALGRDNFKLSGDIMGDASARIEEQLGAPALFVNGAVGDVSPRQRGLDGIAAIGKILSAGVLAVWPRIAADVDQRLGATVETAALPAPALDLRNCLGRWVPRGTRLGLRSALPGSADLLVVAVGGSAWVVIPGELETRLGREIKEAGRGRFAQTFIAGVANAYQGYFVESEQFRIPSYISCGSLYGERGGEILRDAAITALRELGDRQKPRLVKRGR
ncbi:MAG TPA: neutral/alkaline non-lysosomal ceramidase N-terminal domain-containing protein [Candidatus Dormibacteraeota bacterium]|nr:neutral/alkaline non-lysosomal ceramidase N-terminal domain-containing protein [Candidatus Dormibacteraeota bacterium]